MSVIVQLRPPSGPGAAGKNARLPRRPGRRGRLAAIGGSLAALLVLCGLPMPAATQRDELREQAAELGTKLATQRAEVQEVDDYRRTQQPSAKAIHSAFRGWFARDHRLLETRNHLLQVAKVLRLELSQLAVSDEAGGGQPGAPAAQVLGTSAGAGQGAIAETGGGGMPIAIDVERCTLVGEGTLANVVLFVGMLTELTPRLRLVKCELRGAGETRSFEIEAERLYEAAVSVDAALAPSGSQGMMR